MKKFIFIICLILLPTTTYAVGEDIKELSNQVGVVVHKCVEKEKVLPAKEIEELCINPISATVRKMKKLCQTYCRRSSSSLALCQLYCDYVRMNASTEAELMLRTAKKYAKTGDKKNAKRLYRAVITKFAGGSYKTYVKRAESGLFFLTCTRAPTLSVL